MGNPGFGYSTSSPVFMAAMSHLPITGLPPGCTDTSSAVYVTPRAAPTSAARASRSGATPALAQYVVLPSRMARSMAATMGSAVGMLRSPRWNG